MTRTRLLLLLLFPFAGALLVAGLQAGTRAGSIEYGDERPLGDGTVRTFVKKTSDGVPQSLGLLLTSAALQNLPEELPHMGPAYELTVPLPASVRGLPFDHVSVDWNPAGHEPEGMYTLPHFDIHFYIMTEEERNTILPTAPDFDGKATRHPDAAFLPANHVVAPGAVPRMGNHWLDAASPELNGETFTTTFIYGSWDGRVTFLEPMITKAFMESVREAPNQTIRKDIPQPERALQAGFYPKAYTIQYDGETDTYGIVLEDLALR